MVSAKNRVLGDALEATLAGYGCFVRTRSRSSPKGVMSSANEALIRQVIEMIWNRGDLDAADALFAPAYVNHDGLIGDLVTGPEAIKISAALYRTAFPGLHVSLEEVSTVADTVVLRWRARTAPDTLGGAALASNPNSLSGTTRCLISCGKIVESWTEWDRIGVLRQLRIAAE